MGMKQKLIAIVLALAIIFGVGAAVTYYITMPVHSQEIREIWTPQQFHIANQLNGSYVSISEYQNEEATLISFADLQKNYNSSYVNENFMIVVQQNGTVWYVWSFQGVSFKAANDDSLLSLPREGSIINISSDGPKTYLIIVWNILLGGGFLLLVLYLAIIALGIFLGWLFYT
jgi:hypothetical protein